MARTKTDTVGTGRKTDRLREILRETSGGPGVAVDPSGPGGLSAVIARVNREFAARGGFGYAFGYGRADATPDPDFPGRSYAKTRAARRTAKTVSKSGTVVSVRTASGAVIRVDTATDKIVRGR